MVVIGALAAARFAWPSGTVTVNPEGLAQVSSSRFGGQIERVTVRTLAGKPVPVAGRPDGTVVPTHPVTAGTRLVVEVVFRRPSWAGWLVGGTETKRVELAAPAVRLKATYLRVAPGAPVKVRFDRPVRVVRVTGLPDPRTIRPARPTHTVSLGNLGKAGTVGVSAVALGWERLPAPTSVTWFPPGQKTMLLASPKLGTALGPTAPIRLRFSAPVTGPMPALTPRVPGGWNRVDAHTLEFRPRGYGFGLEQRVQVKLPRKAQVIGGRATRTLAWTTPKGSELRLEELLALLRYLPLRWTADQADAPRTIAGQLEAAVDPPRGGFEWRYPNIPPELERLWQPGVYTWMVRGAVMAFQNEHDLAVDGFAGHDVWHALIADAIAGKPRKQGYSYVFVHSSVPQSLNLWYEGQIILTSPGNTGVPAAPTQLGTFAVFEHIPVGTMSGTNPDGSHYNDPGVKWISYFNGGEGIHAFDRASFGTPQSLGCVELPEEAAKKVWPYTPIGTLVTVEK